MFNENPVAKFIEVDGVGKVGELVTSCQVNLSGARPIHNGTLLIVVLIKTFENIMLCGFCAKTPKIVTTGTEV